MRTAFWKPHPGPVVWSGTGSKVISASFRTARHIAALLERRASLSRVSQCSGSSTRSVAHGFQRSGTLIQPEYTA
jgi:hypothetical protein